DLPQTRHPHRLQNWRRRRLPRQRRFPRSRHLVPGLHLRAPDPRRRQRRRRHRTRYPRRILTRRNHPRSCPQIRRPRTRQSPRPRHPFPAGAPVRITKFLIILAIFFLILAVTRTTSAQEESTQSTQNTRNTESTYPLLPGVSTYARSGFGLYRSSACPCFDRQTWNLDLGANLSWHRFASFEAEYRYGTMLLGGNFPTSGYAIGLRTALTPQTHRWWNTLYL